MSRKPLTSLCSPSAAKTAAAARVTAPAVVGQGEGTCLRWWPIRVVLFVNAFLLSVYIVSRAFQ